jgi:hypothetical protein
MKKMRIYDNDQLDAMKSRASADCAPRTCSAAQVWWPQCPWPEAVWTNDVDEIGKMLRKKIGDQNTTAAAGVLMRHGWKIASKEIMDSLIERGLVPPNEKSSNSHVE